jgi:hypothetical protein
MELEGISYYKALSKAAEIDERFSQHLRKDIQKRHGHNIIPREAGELSEQHRNYLIGRRFHPDGITKMYNVLGINQGGKYKFRIIVPCLARSGETINFTALSVLGQQPKYIHCPNEEAIVPMKSLLYNIQSVRDTIVICEGVTDVWRLGNGCVATMGIEFSKEQIQEIVACKVKNAFVLYDAEEYAQKQARKLATNLSGIIDHVEVISLPEGDPGDLSEDDANHLRKELKLG